MRATRRPSDSQRRRARALVLLLGAAIAIAVAPYVTGLLGAAVLYVCVVPVHRRLARRIHARPSAALLTAAAALTVLLPGAWLAGVVANQAPAVVRALGEARVLSDAGALVLGGVDVGAPLARAGNALIGWASTHVFALVGSAVSATLNLVIALVGLYYLLLSAERLWAAAHQYLPFPAASAERLRRRFYGVTEATLLGTALTAVLQGTVVGIAFRLVGLPNAPFWGAVTAAVSILPVLGSALVWLPGALVLLVTGRVGAAVALFLIGAVVASNIDNVMRPMVNRRVSHIHPLATLVGAFAGVRLLGIAGLLLGPLAISYFLELARMYRQEYGEEDTGRTWDPTPLAPVSLDAVGPR